MRSVCGAALWLVLSALFPAAAAGQANTATMRGRVQDVRGTPIPAAAVTITARDTSLARQIATDADGTFVVSNLVPGTVDVSVTASGFGEVKREQLPLEVGQTATIVVELPIATVQENVSVSGAIDIVTIDSSRSVVDAVISAALIQALPLNGRNFLELSLLVPGNTPAPNFDPTKSNSVAISSAGQLGRGGNVTIDGADNNDDVVGGPLQNVTQESVQEFQIVTNRMTAETGRSASSTINVVTKSGTDVLHGSASFFARDSAWQSLPATLDPGSTKPPFDRQQFAAASGGPIVPSEAFWFGALEYRNQDGAVLVGTRDVPARTIRRSFAPAPLDDLLASAKVDWHPTGNDTLTARYSAERENDTSQSTLDRALGTASFRQAGENRFQSIVGSWTRVVSPTIVNALTASYSAFRNRINPVSVEPQLTFPSIAGGASFRVPQGTRQQRLQVADSATLLRGSHTLRAGGEWQHVMARFDLDVFRQGRIEFVEDFPNFDHNGDGRVDDGDLLFAVTLRSGKPNESLIIPDANNSYVALFVQDDWRVRPNLTLNAGLRYEFDTDVKNISRVGDINPIVRPFLHGTRGKDLNNLGPRVGFNWTTGDRRTSVHGGYGVYYDRITLEILSLERGLDGRALPVEVRAGNVFFLDPGTGRTAPVAPTIANPFAGFILPGAGASGINIIDNGMENPQVQQFNLGFQRELPGRVVVRIDGVHNFGTHFIIGRTVGVVDNPVVGGPDRVVNLESSVNTKYDALLISAEQRGPRFGIRAGYALAKAFNYANDDQIPFGSGPLDPNDLQREYGPTPNDQRHRLTLAGWGQLPAGFLVAPIWTIASAVPMDILMPDGQMRVPAFQRNAGGRLFKTAGELNSALAALNTSGGVAGQPLPLVGDSARFGDSFNSLDVRISRPFNTGRFKVEPILEVFNLFDVTNILGIGVRNYSGFANVLVRDSSDPGSPGYLRSSSFGQPVTTAGGVFGSGGPRAFQFAVRASF